MFTPGPDDLITEIEAAQLRRQSIRTLQAERLRGTGCHYYKLGRTVRYRRGDVLQFIREREVSTTNALPWAKRSIKKRAARDARHRERLREPELSRVTGPAATERQ